MSDVLNVLLVGAGRAGLVHARNFAAGIPGARLAAIADPSSEARDRAARELGCDSLFDDPMEAIRDDGIDAVVVAGPTFTHAEIAVAALQAEKHVLCEKPLASDLDQAKAIADAEAASTGSLSMGFMRRFDRGFKRAAQRIAAGDIGRPVLVRSSGRGPGLPPEWAWDVALSGGLIAEVNSHDLDTVRWMSGQELDSAYALGRAAKRPEIAARHPGFVDVLVASFELDGGEIAQIDGACPADYGYDARVEVYGEEGTILVGGPVKESAVLVRKEGAMTDAVGSWSDLFADAYRAEDAHFVDVAREEAAPVTKIEDGLRALEGVVAVNRSLAEQRPVSIEEVRLR